ncbi:MAG: serine/threonine-protein kinase [Plesiomonas shigelloides]
MGEVLFCEDIHLQRKVVLKHLQPGHDVRRLLDEQRALSKIRSKHVVQLYDIVNIGEQSAIILEFIDGDILRPGSFSGDDRYLNVIWQISCGLTDIHGHKIIHRDIKPGNIKIDGEGVVKIFDFGLSRNNFNAETKCIIGTPLYMAPELWSNQTIAFDNSIDVYAYGVTCLALLNDKPIQSLCECPPVQPSLTEFSTAFSGLPREIINALYNCISVDKAVRPSMLDIKELLEKYLLKDRHRATVVLDGNVNTLDCNNRVITLNATVGKLTIEYDGLSFIVKNVTGDVFINNRAIGIGNIVPGCCVFTFGVGRQRKFVTFDISNPEVMP